MRPIPADIQAAVRLGGWQSPGSDQPRNGKDESVDSPTQILPTLPPLERYREQMIHAINQADAAVVRWRKRKAFAERYTQRLDEFNRRRWDQNDDELADAMADYGFWQREVVRLAAQIQALVALEGLRR